MESINYESDSDILKQLSNVPYIQGSSYQKIQRSQAGQLLDNNELQAIYHLVESHAPGLRMKAVFQSEKNLVESKKTLIDNDPALSQYTETDIEKGIENMLGKIAEMPKEWTIIQITPHFNWQENLEFNPKKYYTNSIYMTVFDCGQNASAPFCVSINAPTCNEESLELVQEMASIIESNKSRLLDTREFFRNTQEKLDYYSSKQSLGDRLKNLLKDIQSYWLQEFRCLFIGKYINESIEKKLRKSVQDFLIKNKLGCDEKILNLLIRFGKGYNFLKVNELRKAVQYCFPHICSEDSVLLLQFIRQLSEKLKLEEQKRHPVLLIIDDTLDLIPWEMLDVLVGHPASRLPSLHIAYALFKEHENTINGGNKIIDNPQNCACVVNPDLDLKNSENRITSFLSYYQPQWKLIAGTKPTGEIFEQHLRNADIFLYTGHGSGTQHFPMEKIMKIHIKTVVLLFGCGSAKLCRKCPKIEMYGVHQMYMIACSPCVIGMLWEVADTETDIFTTDFLSRGFPSNNPVPWHSLNKDLWVKGTKVDFNEQKANVNLFKNKFQPELLRTLATVKKSRGIGILTRAACVARGIPVKVEV